MWKYNRLCSVKDRLKPEQQAHNMLNWPKPATVIHLPLFNPMQVGSQDQEKGSFMKRTRFAAVVLFAGGLGATGAAAQQAFEITGNQGTRLSAQAVATFDQPWAMTFLPDGTVLVNTKPGKIFHVTQDGKQAPVSGVPEVVYAGQGGLGDVVLHPGFASNGMVYISYAEAGDGGTAGAVVVRAKLDTSGASPALKDVQRIWEQQPKVSGRGHYSHRIAFGPDGKLFISSGDRQKLTPAQDFDSALGKVIRLNDDGSVPPDNPWQDKGELAKTFWSMGHRNLLGLAFDAEGRLWNHEMGPRHGDELNLVEPGKNYGWPEVSYGNHYSGAAIPDHDTRPEFAGPREWWVPAISPAGLTIYSGDVFASWKGDALIGGLSSRALVHVDIDGTSAKEAERFRMGRAGARNRTGTGRCLVGAGRRFAWQAAQADTCW
jgi:glucose/arabinose dehydrogenase